jgi:hypothetical protein
MSDTNPHTDTKPEITPPCDSGDTIPPGMIRRVWRVSPPDLMSWIPRDAQKRSIALFDFEPDILPNGEVRIDLRVAFRCIAVRVQRGLLHADFYIGCQSAAVRVEVEGSSLTEHTQGAVLSVDYTDRMKRTRNSKMTVEPELQGKLAAGEVKTKLGGVEFEAGSESEFERSFKYDDRVLAAVCLGNGVEWRLDSPSPKLAVRDFLFCNLHLFVQGKCTGSVKGQITVRPSDITLFDSQRRPLQRANSIILLFKLYRKRKRVFRPQGITVNFLEERS